MMMILSFFDECSIRNKLIAAVCRFFLKSGADHIYPPLFLQDHPRGGLLRRGM